MNTKEIAVVAKRIVTKKRRIRRKAVFNIVSARNAIQIVTALVLIYVGWQFYLFVRHFETRGVTPYVPRPALVEGFLPISALVSLKNWIVNGTFDTIHPAGLVIFLTILTISVLLKKGFCSWFCPVGLLSETVGGVGRRLCGRNFLPPTLLDWILMTPKYLVLLFFVKVILIDMDMLAVAAFVDSPYNRIVDVKMLYLFTEINQGIAAFIIVLVLLSTLVNNFWCRYLCPYGALIGLLSLFSPLKVHRNANKCIDCQFCTRACPNRIDVAQASQVSSPECTGCLNCIDVCPKKGALGLKIVGMGREVSVWAYPALLIGLVMVFFLVAYATGHWQTSITYQEYMSLIPYARLFGH